MTNYAFKISDALCIPYDGSHLHDSVLVSRSAVSSKAPESIVMVVSRATLDSYMLSEEYAALGPHSTQPAISDRPGTLYECKVLLCDRYDWPVIAATYVAVPECFEIDRIDRVTWMGPNEALALVGSVPNWFANGPKGGDPA